MTSLFYTEDALNPSNDFVRRRVGGFIQVGDTIANVFVDRAAQGGVAAGDWGVMAGANMKLVVILEEQRPAGSVQSRGAGLRLNYQL